MSISEIAKQAAEWAWDKYAPNRKPAWGRVIAEDVGFEIACNAADAATAKLREELVTARQMLEQCVPHPKSRLTSEELQGFLAHQQPSASTPDVEEIALEQAQIIADWLALPGPALSAVRLALAARIASVAAQARAPLVKALRRMPELAYEVIHEQGSSISVENLPNELQCICDAALAGTGEK